MDQARATRVKVAHSSSDKIINDSENTLIVHCDPGTLMNKQFMCQSIIVIIHIRARAPPKMAAPASPTIPPRLSSGFGAFAQPPSLSATKNKTKSTDRHENKTPIKLDGLTHSIHSRGPNCPRS